MDVWEVLGIEPTSDEKTINAAYDKLLETCRPDTDMEGYQRLRTAYETALRTAKYIGQGKPRQAAIAEQGDGEAAQPTQPQNDRERKLKRRVVVVVAAMVIGLFALAGALGSTGTLGRRSNEEIRNAQRYAGKPATDAEPHPVFEAVLERLHGAGAVEVFDITVGTALEQSALADMGGRGFSGVNEAVSELPAMLERRDWEALYDCMDPYMALSYYYTMNDGAEAREFFGELMDIWMDMLVEDGSVELLGGQPEIIEEIGVVEIYYANGDAELSMAAVQRGGRWYASPFEWPYEDVEGCVLFGEPNTDKLIDLDNSGGNHAKPLYKWNRDGETDLWLLLRIRRNVDRIEISSDMGKYTIRGAEEPDMILIGQAGDDSEYYLAGAHFKGEARYLTGVVLHTTEGDAVEYDIER